MGVSCKNPIAKYKAININVTAIKNAGSENGPSNSEAAAISFKMKFTDDIIDAKIAFEAERMALRIKSKI
jgi:hypothetical protein